MKTVAIMQPYFFPYIGYFQLINAVDSFLIYDDVQYIKGGWINRNRILLNGNPHYITLPVEKGHWRDKISERNFSSPKFEQAKAKIVRQLSSAYGKAPYFSGVMHLVEQVFACEERNVARFLINHLRKVCDYLRIETPFLISSETQKQNAELSGQNRGIAMCKALEAHRYINAIGGMDLYDPSSFEQERIKLNFIKTLDFSYYQFGDTFVPNLSIIDVMMFNDVEQIREYLAMYELV